MKITVNNTQFSLLQGDITTLKVDAIVNAANSTLMGGGGVDGAIHRAGGSQILAECKEIIDKIGSLPAGDAVITGGGLLPAKFVIHTVGPIWRGGSHDEVKILANAYRNSLIAGEEYNIKTIAFPSISTGIYGFPKDKACEIAFNTCKDYIVTNKSQYIEIIFVVFGKRDLQFYQELFNKIK